MLYVAGCWLLSFCFELFVEWWTGELGSQVVTVQRIFHAAGMARCWLLAVVGFWTCACRFLDTQTRQFWSSLNFWGLGHAWPRRPRRLPARMPARARAGARAPSATFAGRMIGAPIILPPPPPPGVPPESSGEESEAPDCHLCGAGYRSTTGPPRISGAPSIIGPPSTNLCERCAAFDHLHAVVRTLPRDYALGREAVSAIYQLSSLLSAAQDYAGRLSARRLHEAGFFEAAQDYAVVFADHVSAEATFLQDLRAAHDEAREAAEAAPEAASTGASASTRAGHDEAAQAAPAAASTGASASTGEVLEDGAYPILEDKHPMAPLSPPDSPAATELSPTASAAAIEKLEKQETPTERCIRARYQDPQHHAPPQALQEMGL